MNKKQKQEVYDLVMDAMCLKPGINQRVFNENLIIYVKGAQGDFLLFSDPETTVVSRGRRTKLGMIIPKTNILRALRWMWSHEFEVIETTWLEIYGLLLQKEVGASEPNL